MTYGSLKVGLVGYGKHAQHVLVPALLNTDAEVVGLCEVKPERVDAYRKAYREIGVFDDYDRMLTELKMDAVMVAANSATHYVVAEHALQHGLDVFIEKTPTETAAQARRLAELELATGRHVMTGFNRRWATGYRMARAAAVREASAGRPIRLYYAKYHARDYGSEDWFIHNHLSHHLDLLRFLLGEVESLRVERLKLSEGKMVYNMSFRTESGALGTLQTASLQSDSFPQEYVEFLGDGWELIVDNHQGVIYNRDGRRAADRLHHQTVALDDHLDTLIWNQNRTMYPPFLHHDVGHQIEIEHWVECCLRKQAPAWHADDMEKTMVLMERFTKAVRSALVESETR